MKPFNYLNKVFKGLSEIERQATQGRNAVSGLTFLQLILLVEIYQNPGENQQWYANKIGISKMTVKQNQDKFLVLGLIRETASPDNRSRCVVLSDQVKNILREEVN